MQNNRKKDMILDAMQRLMNRSSAQSISVSDVAKEAGIGKGSIYYYFKSKEEIMDALVERTTAELFAAAKKVAADQTIPVYQRFVQTVLALRLDTSDGEDMMDFVHKPQNALMHQKMQTAVVTEITPVLASIVEDGIQQGIFQTDYPYETMEMAIVYATAAFDDQELVPQSEEIQLQRVSGFFYLLERMLGVEEGKLAKEMEGMFE